MENLTKRYKVPVLNLPRFHDPGQRRYFIIRKDGTRVLTKKAKDEIKKRLEAEL